MSLKAAQFVCLGGCVVLVTTCSAWDSGVVLLTSTTPPTTPGLFQPRPTGPQSASGIVEFNSDPQGAEAKTPLGPGCRTPCSMEISANGGFTVAFTHDGYSASTVSVKVEPAQPGSDPKFAPNPVFVQLTPVPNSKAVPVA